MANIIQSQGFAYTCSVKTKGTISEEKCKEIEEDIMEDGVVHFESKTFHCGEYDCVVTEFGFIFDDDEIDEDNIGSSMKDVVMGIREYLKDLFEKHGIELMPKYTPVITK